jgi:serine/threonine-protein kinase CLA4
MISSHSQPSPLFPPIQQPIQPQSISRPTPQLTPPTSSSSPKGAGSSSTTAVSIAQKFTPQRAAPLNPSQRQEQITREAERRRRERQERENKELPPVNKVVTPVVKAAPTTPAPSRLPVAVGNSSSTAAGATSRAAAETAKPITKAKPREQRISALTETQIMEKLRSVVSSADPNSSYTKIKKVGQGASGSVYVARYTNSTPLRTKMVNGSQITQGHKVAIKQMDLANQPRKELIVNEILVMKESQHPNIVNFLDSYLVRGNELWVVMEFMEGGALTDVIDHNTLSEDQISCICLEVPPQQS